jgi:hypothetical protein
MSLTTVQVSSYDLALTGRMASWRLCSNLKQLSITLDLLLVSQRLCQTALVAVIAKDNRPYQRMIAHRYPFGSHLENDIALLTVALRIIQRRVSHRLVEAGPG